ncbi:MAG: flagellar hook protein FlgE [Terriglobia bacterium]|nr:flagellar hook protein FlgE [Terriglobia bacterium]
MASFSIPLTGLNADQTELNTIANNISNLNTTGFKSQSTSFEDLFYQQVGSSGSGDPVVAGQGVKVAANSTDFTPGSINTTAGSPSDVALTGNGFFVLNNGGIPAYTRAGDFQTDQNGNLTSADGLAVMGYPASKGVVNTNAPLAAIQIPLGATQQPQATTQFSLNATNLNASAAVGTVVPAQVTVYDSLGQSHVATVNFTNAGTNTWNYAISLPAGDYTGATANTTGTLTFNSSGQMTAPAANVTGISFGGLTDGASNLSFSWNLYDANNNPTVTQAASASTVGSTTQNGYSSGSYQGFSVGSDGIISVQFSNGQTQAIGQLALAMVNNEQGLARTGDNNFAATLASGPATVGVAGTGGRGTMEGGALEDSNVDISSEFSNLIVAQSAYEANAKSVTTFDTVTQATINMIPQ